DQRGLFRLVDHVAKLGNVIDDPVRNGLWCLYYLLRSRRTRRRGWRRGLDASRKLLGEIVELELHVDRPELLVIRCLDAKRFEIQLYRQIFADGNEILGEQRFSAIRLQ